MVMKMNELIIGTFCIGMMVGGVIMCGIDWQFIKRREKAHYKYVKAIFEQHKKDSRELGLNRERLLEELNAYRARVRAAADALKVNHDN